MAVENRSGTFEIGNRTVHRLGFGAMRVTGDDILGEPEDVDEAERVLERCIELGVDFIDTADSYGPGTSERLIQEVLYPYDDVLIATKGGQMRHPNGDWNPNGEPSYLWNALLGSLDRLGVDTIDLYQLHRPDPEVPFEDSVTALAEMRDDGFVRNVGLSNVSVEQLDRAREIVPIETVQNLYHVGERGSQDVLDACERSGIGFIPWFPLGGGDFGGTKPVLSDIADAHDATIYQIAIAWLLQCSPVMLPIPGTGSVAHLEENVAASAIELTDEELRQLED